MGRLLNFRVSDIVNLGWSSEVLGRSTWARRGTSDASVDSFLFAAVTFNSTGRERVDESLWRPVGLKEARQMEVERSEVPRPKTRRRIDPRRDLCK
jgi:hypothetical protein